jgi:hypothetical protein
LTYAAVLTNRYPNLLALNVRVTTRLLDAGGRVLLSVVDTIPFLPPRSSTAVADANTYTRIGRVYGRASDARSVQQSCSYGSWKLVKGQLPTLVASNVQTETINVMDTTATITSTWRRKVYNATLVAVFRDAQGNILGGSNACVGVIPPGTHTGYDAGEVDDTPSQA